MLPSTRKLNLKVVGNTKKFGGGISGSRDGAEWSITNYSIISPQINLKWTQKEPKTKNKPPAATPLNMSIYE